VATQFVTPLWAAYFFSAAAEFQNAYSFKLGFFGPKKAVF
jgi:hypothetical protein